MSTVKCSLKDLAKTLEKELQKDIKQTKFAASKALNNVAFKARTNLITSYQHNFVVRNTNLPKATTVNVTGFLLGGVGYGEATIKGKGSVAVTIN